MIKSGISQEILEELYWNQEKSIKEIAKKLKKGTSTIHRYMIKYGIPRRSYSKAQKLNVKHSGRFQLGHKRGMFGKHQSEETKKKIGNAQMGKKNHQWKGNKVGYFCLHKWIHRHKERKYFCFICNEYKVFTNFANIDNQYKRNLKDYIEVCVSCHRIFDNLMKKRLIE